MNVAIENLYGIGEKYSEIKSYWYSYCLNLDSVIVIG